MKFCALQQAGKLITSEKRDIPQERFLGNKISQYYA